MNTKPFGTPSAIARRPGNSITFAISDDIEDCEAVDMAGYSGGTILLLTGSATTGTVHASDTRDGEFKPVCDSEGTELTVALDDGKRCELPTSSWSEEFIKIKSDAAGTASIKPKG